MTVSKVKFTDRFLKSLKPERERYEIFDSERPGLLVRVSPSGLKTFALVTRFPGKRYSTRPTLGHAWALEMQDTDLPEFQFGLTGSPTDF